MRLGGGFVPFHHSFYLTSADLQSPLILRHLLPCPAVSGLSSRMFRVAEVLLRRQLPHKPRLSRKGQISIYEKHGLLDTARIISGHKSTWAGKKIIRKWHPNLFVKKLPSSILGEKVVLVVSDQALRKINEYGLDKYVLNGFANPATHRMFARSEFAVKLYERLLRKKAENEALVEIEEQAQALAAWIEEQSLHGKFIPLCYETNIGTITSEAVSQNLQFVSRRMAGKNLNVQVVPAAGNCPAGSVVISPAPRAAVTAAAAPQSKVTAVSVSAGDSKASVERAHAP
eukprot:RCo011635